MLSDKVSKALENYEGMWVAVTENEVVAYGTSAKQVHEEAKKKTSKEVIVFKVPLREGVPCSMPNLEFNSNIYVGFCVV